MISRKKFEQELRRRAREAGIQSLHLADRGQAGFNRIMNGRIRPSGAIFARMAKLAKDMRTFDEEFELLCTDFLEAHIELLEHQIDAAKIAFTQMDLRAILADEVGLGKTIEAGIIAKELQTRGMLSNALVIAPTTLMGQWADELKEKFEINLLDARNAPRYERQDHPFWVVNMRSWYRSDSKIRDEVLARDWDLVIIDEAHHLKNGKNGAQYFREEDALNHQYLLLLTATPIENSLRELYTLLHMVRPGALKSYRHFSQQYFENGDDQVVKNSDELRRIVRDNIIRRRRAECGIDYTHRDPHLHSLTPPPAFIEAYEQILGMNWPTAGPLDKIRYLRMGASSVRALRASLSNVPTLQHGREHAQLWKAIQNLEDDGEPKLHLLHEIVEDSGPTVVFTEFKHTLQGVKEYLESQGHLVHALHSGLNMAQRKQSVRNFKDKRGVFVTTPVGSEGLNLQTASSVVVNFDLPWNPMKVEQRVGRVHRIGQKDTVRIHTLTYRGTIEDFILATLYRKLNLFKMSVGEIDGLFTRGTGNSDFQLEAELNELVKKRTSLKSIEQRLRMISDRLSTAQADGTVESSLAQEVLS